MMGIALQQMEIFPLHVCRHVLKYILSRQITWFDLAFYDPAMVSFALKKIIQNLIFFFFKFDSLRSIVYNDAENTAHSNDFYESLQLTFAVDLSPEEVGFEAWKKVDFLIKFIFLAKIRFFSFFTYTFREVA